jgi:hypothetical protein
MTNLKRNIAYIEIVTVAILLQTIGIVAYIRLIELAYI